MIASSWDSACRSGSFALVSLYDTENNAVRQLAAGCRRAGLRVLEIYFKDWRNNRFEEATSHEEAILLRVLRREGVSLVGLSLRASAYEGAARRLCQLIRNGLGIPVLVGGWHATVRPDACLDFADAICVGEADGCLPAFLQDFFGRREMGGQRGFWVRRGTEVRKGAHAEPTLDLDQLPWRDYTHPDKFVIQRDSLTRGDPMARDPLFQTSASIGCVQRCSFCHNSFLVPGTEGMPRLRLRSVDNVLAELASARSRNAAIRRVRFDDEIFGLDNAWLEDFARRYPREHGLPFDILTEPTVVTERYADLLRQAGASTVHLGLQYSEEVNRRELRRRGSREQTLRAIRLLTQRGIEIRYLVMVDIPGISSGEKQAFYDFIRQLPRPHDVYLFSLTWFPGSAMVDDMLRDGRLDPSQVEGAACKTFRQYRVDLFHPRSPEDVYWLSLLVLLSSQVVPVEWVDRLAEPRLLRVHPGPLRALASMANLVKTGRVAMDMGRRGELTTSLVRRWLNANTMITM